MPEAPGGGVASDRVAPGSVILGRASLRWGTGYTLPGPRPLGPGPAPGLTSRKLVYSLSSRAHTSGARSGGNGSEDRARC